MIKLPYDLQAFLSTYVTPPTPKPPKAPKPAEALPGVTKNEDGSFTYDFQETKMKYRDPASHAKVVGKLRTIVHVDKQTKIGRKAKHKKALHLQK